MKARSFRTPRRRQFLRRDSDGMPVAHFCPKVGISQATYFHFLAFGPLGLHQSIRPVVGALRSPGHDGFRASPSQLSYPAYSAAPSIGFSGDAG